MQYRSRAAAPASPTASTYAASAITQSTRTAGSSSSHYDSGSASSLVYHSSESEEDLGDPDVLAHDICDFFGGVPAPKKAKKPKAPKAPKAPKQKPVVLDLPVGATTAAQPREGGSRLRRLCKAIVPTSKA
ncbi:hypothetical protein FRC09_017302 [Ceratobasidium sp. 395]|nr:hypothetical protein FRC09_017302 [Ceratobasidium sp. 395]